jgi:hypothetical protein
MTRRRFLIAACVIVVALGAAWWLLADRLTVEEQRLVGTWRADLGAVSGVAILHFDADRRSRLSTRSPSGNLLVMEFNGPWSVCGGKIVIEGEANSFLRAVRPLLSVLGLPHGGNLTLDLESAADDEMATSGFAGASQIWTRVRED